MEHCVVVEPHERADYMAHGAKRSDLLVLPASHQGLAYARQFIVDHARSAGEQWIWMLDDDVRAFEITGEKTSTTEALERAEDYFISDERNGQAAIEYQQFAWRAKQPFVRNSYCDIVVALRVNVEARYRPEAGLKEDRDYTLQIRAEGWDTVRVTEVAFAAPTMGTNRGGLFDEYQAGRESESAAALARMWPNLVTVIRKPSGRIDARINWRAAGAA